jgi:hypothetical protein
MRELTIDEIEQVSGGTSWYDLGGDLQNVGGITIGVGLAVAAFTGASGGGIAVGMGIAVVGGIMYGAGGTIRVFTGKPNSV